MLGKIFGVGLIVGISVPIAAVAGPGAPHAGTCAETCAVPGNGAGHEAFDESIARIAMRAATPRADKAPLTEREWLSLYLLLSLKTGGKNAAL